jgi:endonuclease/exonuclease/phosphatase family metal-dependent hydrolase
MQKHKPSHLRVVTWNIHKGVRGVGPRKRLEIHAMQQAVQHLDADLICLQEVRLMNRKEAAHFTRWPELGQADFLAPEGYESVYRTNAITRHGEHGNALLSRHPVVSHQHEDMSDHRFEQRGLLHCVVHVHRQELHVIVVHLGLIAASRRRQMDQLSVFIAREVPLTSPLIIAGDFNAPLAPIQWARSALKTRAPEPAQSAQRPTPTFPSRLPLVQLDHVLARHARVVQSQALRTPIHGLNWARMSDHLPLVVDIELHQSAKGAA